MLLYTIIPLEVIFGEETETELPNWREDATRVLQAGHHGKNLLLQSLPDGRFKIDRLISTDARDYLNPNWQPGTVLRIF